MLDSGPVRPPRRQHRVPRRDIGQRFAPWPLRRRPRVVSDDRERPVEDAAQLTERHDGVDHPMSLQVLGGLDAGRERFAVELLVHPRPEKADQSARLGEGEVTQRTPRREHPAGGRVAQVHQVGQVCLLVQGDGRGDLDHLQKRDGAFLHPGAAGARRRQQRQPLGRGAFHRGGDPLGRGDPDRAAQEVELADHHRHAAVQHPALTGQHRFVVAAGGSCLGQLAGVRLAHRYRQRRAVPADERSLIEHRIAQLVGPDPAHPAEATYQPCARSCWSTSKSEMGSRMTPVSST